ncbi:MAG: tetratricopeptide repeat protein [Desulfobulbaceae bacterium]|nr:tetratricopeptide repeat protein [Gammaproteobacteria bacterium]RZW13334.1 MAG: tetratricopeptide repeat protein [Desulfobulbaceae bacterium]
MDGELPDIEFLFSAAVRFHQQGNLQRASELYDRVQSLDPLHVMSLNNQALIARAVGRLDLSLRMLQRALELEPENFEILANLGRVSLQNKQALEAEYYLQAALQLKPEDRKLRIYLAKAFHQQGRHVEASTLFDELLQQDSNNFDLLYALGTVSASEQNNEQALEYFYKALQIRPEDDQTREWISELSG